MAAVRRLRARVDYVSLAVGMMNVTVAARGFLRRRAVMFVRRSGGGGGLRRREGSNRKERGQDNCDLGRYVFYNLQTTPQPVFRPTSDVNLEKRCITGRAGFPSLSRVKFPVMVQDGVPAG